MPSALRPDPGVAVGLMACLVFSSNRAFRLTFSPPPNVGEQADSADAEEGEGGGFGDDERNLVAALILILDVIAGRQAGDVGEMVADERRVIGQ